MAHEVREVAPALWIWRVEHPDWEPGFDWEPLVTSTCVEAGGEVTVLDPLAPPDDAADVWARVDPRPPTIAVVLKPDQVRDVDLFVRRYGARAVALLTVRHPGDRPRAEQGVFRPGSPVGSPPGDSRTRSTSSRW